MRVLLLCHLLISQDLRRLEGALLEPVDSGCLRRVLVASSLVTKPPHSGWGDTDHGWGIGALCVWQGKECVEMSTYYSFLL